MSARRSQAAMSMARKKGRKVRATTTPAVAYQSSRVSAGHEDSVNFMQLDPEVGDEPNNSWTFFTAQDKTVLVILKLFDLLLSMYLVGIVTYSIYLNSIILFSSEVRIEQLYKLQIVSHLNGKVPTF